MATNATQQTTNPPAMTAAPLPQPPLQQPHQQLATQLPFPAPHASSADAARISVAARPANRSHSLASGSAVTDAPFSYDYSEMVRWKGRRYLFKLKFPLSKETLSAEEQKALKTALDRARDIFLADLEEKGNQSITEGGADFNFIFTESGYTAYVPDKTKSSFFDPEAGDFTEAKANGTLVDFTQSHDAAAKALSTAIQSKVNGEELLKTLTQDRLLSEIYNRTQPKPKSTEIVPLRPIGFENKGENICYLNSAVQQWATNPLIRKELLKDGVIKGGDQNPLYKVLKEYDDRQGDKEGSPLNLTELRDHLKLQKGQQQDIEDAFRALEAEIDMTKIKDHSILHSPIKEFIREDKEGSEWRPGAEKERLLNQKVFFLRDSPQSKSVSELLKNTHTKGVELKPAESTKNTPHLQRAQFTSPPKTLRVSILRDAGKTGPDGKTVVEARKVISEKDTNRIEAVDSNGKMTLAGELYGRPGKSTAYELMSFSLHLGDTAKNGHYVTYVREGEKYWRISDDQIKSDIKKEEFYEQSKLASTLIYNQEGLTLSNANSVPTHQEYAPKQTIKGTSVTLEAEVGPLIGEEESQAIVCPANSTLAREEGKNQAIYDAIPSLPERIAEKVQSTNFAVKAYRKWSPKKYDEREVVVTDGDNKVKKVFHYVEPRTKLTKKQIEDGISNILSEAEKEKVSLIRLPLLFGKGTDSEVYKWMQEAIIKHATKHNGAGKKSLEVKIVLTQEQADRITNTQPVEKTKAIAEPSSPPQPKMEQLKIVGNNTLVIETRPTATSATTGLALDGKISNAFHNSQNANTIVFDFTKGPKNTDDQGTVTHKLNLNSQILKWFQGHLANFVNDNSGKTIKVILPAGESVEQLRQYAQIELKDKNFVGQINATDFIVEEIDNTTKKELDPNPAIVSGEALTETIRGELKKIDQLKYPFAKEIILHLGPGKGKDEGTDEHQIISINANQNDVVSSLITSLEAFANIPKTPIRVLIPNLFKNKRAIHEALEKIKPGVEKRHKEAIEEATKQLAATSKEFSQQKIGRVNVSFVETTAPRVEPAITATREQFEEQLKSTTPIEIDLRRMDQETLKQAWATLKATCEAHSTEKNIRVILPADETLKRLVLPQPVEVSPPSESFLTRIWNGLPWQ